jgi:hypothetical protein
MVIVKHKGEYEENNYSWSGGQEACRPSNNVGWRVAPLPNELGEIAVFAIGIQTILASG